MRRRANACARAQATRPRTASDCECVGGDASVRMRHDEQWSTLMTFRDTYLHTRTSRKTQAGTLVSSLVGGGRANKTHERAHARM
eukprot:6186345-Pleurochrysis_carterae.AAC.3